MARKKLSFLLGGFLLLIVCGISFSAFYLTQKTHPVSHVSDAERTRLFLKNHQQENGLFLYEFDFVKGRPTHWENLKHQAFAGYVLSQDNRYQNEVKKLLKALTDLSAESSYGGESIHFHLLSPSQKEVSYTSLPRHKSEMETTALALVTANQYISLNRDNPETQEIIKQSKLWKKSVKAFIASPQFPLSPIFWFTLSSLPEENQRKSPFSSMSLLDKYFLKKPVDFFKSDTDFIFALLAAKNRLNQTRLPKYQEFIDRLSLDFAEKAPPMKENTASNTCLTATALSFSTLKEALNRSELEKAHSLSLAIQPKQKWIALGEGRILYTPDLKNFTGAYLSAMDRPVMNLFDTVGCLFLLQSEENK